MLRVLLTLGLLALATPSFGKQLKVLTTTTTLADLVQRVGGDLIEVDSLTRGSQDPHYVEAKPSYMIKLRNADLVVAVGLDLEVGWLSNIIRGSKNPRILPGQKGYLELGTTIHPIGALASKADRSQGDVHAQGNPHFHLDPKKMIVAATALANRLSELKPHLANQFKNQANAYAKEINNHIEKWQLRITDSKIKKLITYHDSFIYFLNRFGLERVGSIEPTPGVPPTARQMLSLINTMKQQKITCILNESYFEKTAALRLIEDSPARLEVVPVEVGAVKGVNNYFALIDHLVAAIESCGKFKL